ncbi:MAG: hypothetical protein KKB13_04280 [Chloroflexi bacterium]|nr:hypothetical protein [Chloroflexota bacterium]
MNLHDCIDRSQPGRVRIFKGHRVHIQALAHTRANEVVLLLLQGRPTDARAVWAMFHEGDLDAWSLRRAAGKDAYVKPNPTARLAQGDLEILVAHAALFAPTVADWGGDECYTFGPPHFAPVFQAALPVPLLPHWEPVLWELGRQADLVTPLAGHNPRVWRVDTDPAAWLRRMAQPRWRARLTYEPEADHVPAA